MDLDPGGDQSDAAADTVSGTARRTTVPKCPAPIKAAIKRAIAEHIQQHGRKDWYLVRERPEFAPWIAVDAGPSAHKKFFRWVNSIAKPIQKDRTRPHEAREAGEAHESWARAQANLAASCVTLPIPVSPRHIMANGNTAIVGYYGLGRLMANGVDDIERVRAHALKDDPAGIGGRSAADPDLLLKTSGKICTLVQTALGLFREINATWAREAFHHAVVELLNEKLSGHAELRDEVMTGLAKLISDFGGVPDGAI